MEIGIKLSLVSLKCHHPEPKERRVRNICEHLGAVSTSRQLTGVSMAQTLDHLSWQAEPDQSGTLISRTGLTCFPAAMKCKHYGYAI